MSGQERPVKALGEVVLRARDLQAMQDFFESVIGLEILRRFEHSVFFALGPSYGGHTQVLGIFDESIEPNHASRSFTGLNPEATSLHHVALVIDQADFAGELARLRDLGQHVETQQHKWAHWRSMYLPDPEGNVVELVCYDQGVG